MSYLVHVTGPFCIFAAQFNWLIFAAQLCFSHFAARQLPVISQRILLISNYLRYEIADSGILQCRFLKGHVWG